MLPVKLLAFVQETGLASGGLTTARDDVFLRKATPKWSAVRIGLSRSYYGGKYYAICDTDNCIMGIMENFKDINNG